MAPLEFYDWIGAWYWLLYVNVIRFFTIHPIMFTDGEVPLFPNVPIFVTILLLIKSTRLMMHFSAPNYSSMKALQGLTYHSLVINS